MTEKTKHTYVVWYDIATERDAIEAKCHFKALSGFEVAEHTEDERKGLGKLVMVKTFYGTNTRT